MPFSGTVVPSSSCYSGWCTRRASGRELAAFIFQSLQAICLQIRTSEVQSSYYTVWGSEWGRGHLKIKASLSPLLLFWRTGQTSNPGNMGSRFGSSLKCEDQTFLLWNASSGVKHIKYLFCFLFADIFFPTVLSHPHPHPHLTYFYQLLDAKMVK